MRSLPRTARALAAAFGVVAALLPNAAAAHASLISSQPSPNATYATSPGVVVLVFSEPLNVALSWAGVTTPAGRRARATVVQQRQMQVPVPDTAPGVYQVEWTTVSALDGHVLSGGFEFGVRVRVPGTETEAGPALAISDRVLAALRWIEYLGLLMAVGMLVLSVLARRSPALTWAARSPVVPLAVALASGVAVVAVETANAADALTPDAARTYLLAGTAGPARLARLLAEAVAVAVAVRRPGLAALPVVAAITALAASGHSASLPAWPAPIVLDALHLASAGVWAGAILAMAALRPPDGWLSGAGRTLLQRFAPVALAAFPVTLLTGVVQAVLDVGEPQRLLSTAYGNTLLVKVLLVAAMLPLSLVAWRRARARPRLEAGIAALVVAASSLLASFPATPARLGAGETAMEAASSQSLPLDGALSLASHAGETLVALTVRPGNPGQNSVYLDLLPVAGPAAAERLRPSLSIDGHAIGVGRCGVSCWAASTDLYGGEHLEVHLPDVSEVASFHLPALPAADASGLVSRLEQRMAALRTYRIEEVLRPSAVPLHTSYWFQTPDRLRYDIGGGHQTIIIGGTRYERASPAAAWSQEPAVPVRVPSYPWESAQARAPYVIGSDPSRGTGVTVVAFFEDSQQQPVWFRLWVDPSGLVLRAEMTTPGHFMEDDFLDHDAALLIQPPLP